ncbi:MAG: hypothetical protein KAY32_09925 [Candidatus Eisenbacteria sp.]|nr:hypothetical protein [Candidatus Eisenbacteria bacterium]
MRLMSCRRVAGALLVLPFVLLLVLPLILQIPLAAPADVPVIENEAPVFPPLTLKLEETWRVGGDESDLLFGTVTETATDKDGNVYLLDSQLSQVVVISPAGEHVRTLSREGEGPGEVRQPRDIICLPDETIGIMMMFPAKLVRLTREGDPLESITAMTGEGEVGDFTAGALCASRGGNLVLAATKLLPTEHGQDRVMYLCRLSDTGRETVRYCESRMSLDFRKLHFIEREISPSFHSALALGPDGRVYVGQAWDRYAVEVYHPDGTLERVITRAFENRKRTKDELRRVNALFDASARNNPYGETREVEPSPPVIAGLHVDNDGRLWVLHSRGAENLPQGIMQSYDLFDADGRYSRRVHVACDGDPDYDGLTLLPDGRILLIKGLVLAGTAQSDLGSIPLGEEEEAGNMEFVCYRVAG